MKNLLGIAALMLAFTPFAHAQGLSGHPDARNDRQRERVVVMHPAHHAIHHHHVKRHHPHHAR